jgi:hypothetical protein
MMSMERSEVREWRIFFGASKAGSSEKARNASSEAARKTTALLTSPSNGP